MESKPESLVQLKRYVGPRIADRWHDVGIQLMFTVEELEQIEQNYRPTPVEDCYAGNVYYASRLSQALNLLGQEQVLDFAYLESNVVCRIATDWYDVGLFLDIPEYELDRIRQLSNPTGSKCNEMMRMWLISRTPDDPDISRRNIWRNMYDAMIAVELIKAAEDLKHDLRNIDTG
ncbi:uncharacterized protein [Dysidea avara]|uniref:uncharacterized protein n=1 Tax=Dysidea avara TaxID=196820 RepID=UPI003329E188